MIISRKFNTTLQQLAKQVPKNTKGKGVSSHRWLERQMADPFVALAKQQNFRCRSAFKLLDIDDKSHILAPGHVIVDCGAAPGSWTQVAAQRSNADGNMKDKPIGFVVGVDLLNIYPVEGAHTLGGCDFTDPAVQSHIKAILNGRQIDCILSDMAPNATGVRQLDQENITTLCYKVLRFAVLMSSPNASLLVKVWDNGDVPKLEEDMRRFYRTVKRAKPTASRADSAENFILAKGFLGLESKPS